MSWRLAGTIWLIWPGIGGDPPPLLPARHQSRCAGTESTQSHIHRVLSHLVQRRLETRILHYKQRCVPSPTPQQMIALPSPFN